MTTAPILDGPRRIFRHELRAADLLSQICFNFGGEIPPDDETGEPSSDEEALYKEAGKTYVIAMDGQPVSQICTFQERIHALDGVIRAGCIGGVCTHPNYRGYGLATKLMDFCARKLVEGGARIMLISGGRGLYTRLGNVPVGKYANFILRPGQNIGSRQDITLRTITGMGVDTASRLFGSLYAAEPVRYERKLEDFRNHFRRYQPGYNQEEWVVEMNDRPEAYLMLNTDWQYLDRPEAGQRRVYEYAGSRIALAAALSAAVEQSGIHVLEAGIPWQDTNMIQLLTGMVNSPAWGTLDGHTMRIINFPGLQADLKSYIQARLSPELCRGLRFEQSGPLLGAEGDDRCAIARGKDRLELNTAQMTALVMGVPCEVMPEISVTFPGALTEVIPTLFPLPSFLPGISYH